MEFKYFISKSRLLITAYVGLRLWYRKRQDIIGLPLSGNKENGPNFVEMVSG